MDTASESIATPSQIANLIRQRKTLKVLGRVEHPVEISRATAAVNQANVLEAIRTAGWAPFHYDRNVGGLAEPWRVHVLWHQECRQVAKHFNDWFDDVKPGNKLPAMLSACGAAILVTWLPQFSFIGPSTVEAVTAEKQQAVNEEHLAATAAMIQNLLLMLTAFEMGSYWSSGGQFRSPIMFDKLGMDSAERLLSLVFVEFPETMNDETDRVPGKQRHRRCSEFGWIREAKLAPKTD